MGVQEPDPEAIVEAPATPPGVRDLASDDDLFAKTDDEKKPPLTIFGNNLFDGILPVIPYKGMYELIEVDPKNEIWHLQSPVNKRKKNREEEDWYASVEEVKKDLRKFQEFVKCYKAERDDLKAENENLKKEVEELKTLLTGKDVVNAGVKVSINNKNEDSIDVLVSKNIKNAKTIQNYDTVASKINSYNVNNKIQSLSVSVPSNTFEESKFFARKSIAQSRKEFFENAFKSEQKTFTSRNYIEIKPQQNATFRSQLNIRVKPKKAVSDVISKLSSKFEARNALISSLPEVAPISMFQRFEKRKVVWVTDFV